MTRQLLGWFLLLIVVSVGLMGWIANRTAASTFSSFRNEHTMGHIHAIPVTLGLHYHANSGWGNVERELSDLSLVLRMETALLAPDGSLVATTSHHLPDLRLIETTWAEETIELKHPVDKTAIGTLHLARNSDLRDADSMFFEMLLRGSGLTILTVGLVASTVALLATRRIAAPIRRLADATQQVMSGDYSVRVDAHDRDEIGRLGLAFNEMADEIGNLERVRRDLVQNVSHDLRTPLTVVNGYLEALQTGKIADRRAAEKAFEIMATEISYLQSMIDDLNQVAALDAGQVPLKKHPTDIADLIQTTVTRIAHQAEQKEITIVTDAVEALPPIDVDAAKVGQVIFNLLDNSIHYSPVGGQITIHAQADEATVKIVVSDNGEGISAEHLPFIFERFYRGDARINRAVGGYGMGLSIARSIVNVHGGTIEASNNESADGCSFSISLPL